MTLLFEVTRIEHGAWSSWCMIAMQPALCARLATPEVLP